MSSNGAQPATVGAVDNTERVMRDVGRVGRLNESIAKAEGKGDAERAGRLTAERDRKLAGLSALRDQLNETLGE